MNFQDCVIECCRNPELIKSYDRLHGSSLYRILIKDNRTKLEILIDQATGYQEVLNKKFEEEIKGFFSFVLAYVWMPLVIREK